MHPTAEEIRATVAAAKVRAHARFRADWGTDSVAEVMGALAKTIPGSASPQDAAMKARRMIG